MGIYGSLGFYGSRCFGRIFCKYLDISVGVVGVLFFAGRICGFFGILCSSLNGL